MKDESDASTDETAPDHTNPNSSDTSNLNRAAEVDEIIRENLEIFVKLAESNLPVSEDAGKAIALTDGGEDQ